MSQHEQKSPEQALLDEIANQITAAERPDREKEIGDDDLMKFIRRLAAQRDALNLLIARYKKEANSRIKDI